MPRQPQPPSRLGFSRLVLLAVTLLVALVALTRCSFAQEPSRRLILKDGSYQLVTKYEVKGDRVHYFSTERDEWEELPSSLVDWPATDKYEIERAASASAPEAVQFDKQLEHELELEEAAQPQVAPGLRLPEDSGVFLLDTFQTEPQLVELQQTAGDLDSKAKGKIFSPITGLKQAIELEGAHAKVQSHVDVPSLYINVEPVPGAPDQPGASPRPAQSAGQTQQPQQPEQALVPFDRFRIIRAEVKGGKRILGDVKRAVTGKITQQQHFVPTTITGITGGWLKLTPTTSLAPGEYALVEMVGSEGLNLDVWDFGVNPKAPANPNPWKPEVKSSPPPPAVDKNK
jgi:hypothetical protein